MLATRVFFGAFFALAIVPAAFAAKCKVSDLTACLDSVCNAAADGDLGERCYACGTASAKRPEKQKYELGDTPQMQSLSLGKSSKNTISDKDLKGAPSDPGARYQWATTQCVKKLSDCGVDDVSDNYDKLIEQSCKAAMGDAEYAASMKKSAVKKTKDVCSSELTRCLLSEAKCDANMLKCEEDAELDRNFSACIVEATGCDDFTAELRGQMVGQRDDMVSKKDERIDEVVTEHKRARKQRFDDANKMCANNGRDGCVAEMCGYLPGGLNDMGNCADQLERQWAMSLCKFVDVACDKMK